MDGAGGMACFLVVAAGALDDEAAGGRRIGRIAAGGIFQHGGNAFGHRAAGLQDIGERNCIGHRIAVEDPPVEAHLAAEGGVEARRVDPQRGSDLGHADGIVAACMEEMLGRADGRFRIEAAGAATGARIFCSIHYIKP